MTGVLGLIVVLLLWRFLIIWGETVFEAAGLPASAARFEARSALVGAGYTTSESEYVVQHPVARKVASTLMVSGYIGPAAILALLGVSFVLPSAEEDLTSRAIALVLLLVVVVVLDRVGLFRLIGAWPGRALARRMLGNAMFETWIVIVDNAVATAVIPREPSRAEAASTALADPTIEVLAVEPAPGDPSASEPRRDDAAADRRRGFRAGDRVVVFGPRSALEPLRRI